MELKGNGIVITRTKREGSTAWWWIANEHKLPKEQSPTYQYRELIKAAGGRWSRKRRQWYLIREELPDDIRALVDEQEPTPDSESPPQNPKSKTDAASQPKLDHSDVKVIHGGKILSRTTMRELEQQGLATVQWQAGHHKRLELAGILFQTEGFIFREVRLITEADRQQRQLAKAQLQVENYLQWLSIVEKWQHRAAILALPEPAEDQPPVQILAPIEDPWS